MSPSFSCVVDEPAHPATGYGATLLCWKLMCTGSPSRPTSVRWPLCCVLVRSYEWTAAGQMRQRLTQTSGHRDMTTSDRLLKLACLPDPMEAVRCCDCVYVQSAMSRTRSYIDHAAHSIGRLRQTEKDTPIFNYRPPACLPVGRCECIVSECVLHRAARHTTRSRRLTSALSASVIS